MEICLYRKTKGLDGSLRIEREVLAHNAGDSVVQNLGAGSCDKWVKVIPTLVAPGMFAVDAILPKLPRDGVESGIIEIPPITVRLRDRNMEFIKLADGHTLRISRFV